MSICQVMTRWLHVPAITTIVAERTPIVTMVMLSRMPMRA